MKKILICGDSYMARDYMNLSPWSNIHWSHQLEDQFEIYNNAIPGASNCIIARQVREGIEKINPDYVIIGFTSDYRVEFGINLTNCHPEAIQNKEYLKFYNDYVRYVPNKIEYFRNHIIALHTVEYAKKHAPTVFFLNQLEFTVKMSEFLEIRALLESSYPFKLIGHSEWSAEEDDNCTFHVKDPQIHLALAQSLKENFLL